ncbi:hypothetical protein SAMN05421636_105121 [Pricia antarctica]|uniref:Uncharacterized protein n=1 Tax=Pricia antarctica TaxID=641691 RepID=A0A1G7D112_9FLAO|nr:hypothetical protein [Pricia antarctica]SDE45219.1 hypothetical protein SAMN05421636_105121 [Pricia antarctica]
MNIAIFNIHNWEKKYLENTDDGKNTQKILNTYMALDTSLFDQYGTRKHSQDHF